MACAGIAVLGHAALAQTPAPAAVETVIHAGRLIDGTSTTVRERVSVLIAGDRIVDVQPGFAAPAGAKVIDLSSATVMPGFIDSHTHITSELGGNAIVNTVTMGAVDDAVRATVYAKIGRAHV